MAGENRPQTSAMLAVLAAWLEPLDGQSTVGQTVETANGQIVDPGRGPAPPQG